MGSDRSEFQSVEWWACSHCGPHPSSRANWCDWGCGSDYNRMSLVSLNPWHVVAVLASLWSCHERHPFFQPWPPHGLADHSGREVQP